jgi:hypothetical protein
MKDLISPILIGLMVFCVLMFLMLVAAPVERDDRLDQIIQHQQSIEETLLQILIYVEER